MRLLNKLYLILFPLFAIAFFVTITIQIKEFNTLSDEREKDYINSNIEDILNLQNDSIFSQYFDYIEFNLENEANINLNNIKTIFKRHLEISSQYGKNINDIVFLSKDKKILALESIDNVDNKHILDSLKGINITKQVTSYIKDNEHMVIVPVLDSYKTKYSKKDIKGYLLVHNTLHIQKITELKENFIIKAVFINILFLVIFILITYLLSRIISKPINQLSQNMEHLDSEVYKDIKIDTDIKELKILEETVTQMSNQIIKKQKDIEELNHNLEKKVKNRTKKLSIAYEDVKQYKQLFDQNKAAMLFIDSDTGKIVDANNAALEFYQYSYEEFLKKYIYELNTLSKEEINAEIKKANEEKRNHFFFEHQLKDGTIKSVEVHSGPITLQNKKLLYSTIHDISEQKRQAQIILDQSKQASMGEMIGNIAHQWRQPLSVISTASTGIIMEKEYGVLDETKLIKTCNVINDNAQYLSKTIDDFRNFIQDDKEKNRFDLSDDIDSFLSLVEGTIKINNIVIIPNIEKNIEIYGYENELTQCLINIFNNAKDALKEKIAASEDRFIFISTSLENDKAIVKIKDNAGGIPKEVLPKIFDPYFTTKHSSQGTGLGLHITYNLIVDGMGGTIEVNNIDYEYEEKKYQGVEFTISLPLN